MTFAIAILVAAMLQANPAQDVVDVSALTALESVWNQAHIRGDVQALDRLWAADLVVVVPKMKPMSRAEAMKMTLSAGAWFDRYDSSDLRVRVYGDTALVTGRLVRSRRMTGITVEDVWLFTKVYARTAGEWKVVAFHTSEAP
jgi:ketosteroid isomerase-like protein